MRLGQRLDQQQLDSQLVALRSTLQGVDSAESFAQREAQLRAELNRQPDLTLRITRAGQRWFDGAPSTTLPEAPGLHSLQDAGTNYRVYNVPLTAGTPDSPQLSLMLDITHHQHFLQRMQHLIWLTVGLSALATALLGAWAARSGLRPLRRMGDVEHQAQLR